MVSKLEGTGKKPSATALRCYLVVFSEKLRDITKSLTFAVVPSEIRKKTFRMRARSVSSCANLLGMNHKITLVAEKAFQNNINGRTFVRRSHITFLIRHTAFAVNLTQLNKVTWYESICYFQNAKLLFHTRVCFAEFVDLYLRERVEIYINSLRKWNCVVLVTSSRNLWNKIQNIEYYTTVKGHVAAEQLGKKC